MPGFWNDQKAAKQVFAKLKILKEQWEPVSTLTDDVNALLELLETTPEEERKGLEQEAKNVLERWAQVEHLLYFSSRSMTHMLEGVGFQKIRIGRAMKVLSPSYVLRHNARFLPGIVGRLHSLTDGLLPGNIREMPVVIPSGLIAIAERGTLEM